MSPSWKSRSRWTGAVSRWTTYVPVPRSAPAMMERRPSFSNTRTVRAPLGSLPSHAPSSWAVGLYSQPETKTATNMATTRKNIRGGICDGSAGVENHIPRESFERAACVFRKGRQKAGVKVVLSGYVVIASSVSLFLSGCGSIEPVAPPVTPALAAAARADEGELEHGRLIYTTRCTACHNAERIARYSRSQWAGILPRMSDEARLNDAQARAVTVYVMALARD